MSLLIILYILTPIIVNTILNTVNSSLLHSKITSPFFLSYFIFSYLGFPLLFYNLSNYNYLEGNFKTETLNTTFLISSFSIIIVAISFAFFKVLFSSNNSFRIQKPLLFVNKNALFFLLVVSICFLFIYIDSLNSIGLFEILKGSGLKNTLLARSNATNNLSHAWRFQFFPKFVIPFISYILIVESKYKDSKRLKILKYLSIFFSVFYCLMNAQKGPLLFYLWSIIFLIYFLKNKKIEFKNIIKIISGGFLLLIIIVYMLTGSTINSISTNLLNRIFSGSIFAGYNYVKIFPVEHEFLLGSTLPNPSGIFNFKVFELTKFISLKVFGVNELGIVGSTPAPFWGELYANFSFFGVFFGSIIIGLIFFLTEKIFAFNLRKSYKIALFVSISFYLREWSTSGMFQLIFPLEIILLVIFSFFLHNKFKIA